MVEPLTRRSLGKLVAGSIAGVAGCRRSDDVRLRVHPLADLETGEPYTFRDLDGHDAFLVKIGVAAEQGVGPDGDIVAFHTACPHMGCPINPTADAVAKAEFGPCTCHQSLFDLVTGKQIVGRATQHLVRVVLEIEDGEIYAIRTEGLPFGEAMLLG